MPTCVFSMTVAFVCFLADGPTVPRQRPMCGTGGGAATPAGTDELDSLAPSAGKGAALPPPTFCPLCLDDGAVWVGCPTVWCMSSAKASTVGVGNLSTMSRTVDETSLDDIITYCVPRIALQCAGRQYLSGSCAGGATHCPPWRGCTQRQHVQSTTSWRAAHCGTWWGSSVASRRMPRRPSVLDFGQQGDANASVCKSTWMCSTSTRERGGYERRLLCRPRKRGSVRAVARPRSSDIPVQATSGACRCCSRPPPRSMTSSRRTAGRRAQEGRPTTSR